MIRYTTMNDDTHGAQVAGMMGALYLTDPAAHAVDESHFGRTIARILIRPETGRIVLFEDGPRLAGYALLIPYWSNEFGGELLFVDELFVDEAWRGQGIAKAFFAWLEANPGQETVALVLEVTPDNAGARRLYEGLGFAKRKNDMLVKRIK
jgi:GNAT superfamily N-acetyltransferase